jgi:5-methylcytosine-specific restriction endonuclease McrA
LLSRKYPQGVDYDVLFGELAEMFLERMDPQRKHQRRKERREKRLQNKVENCKKGAVSVPDGRRGVSKSGPCKNTKNYRSRHIPIAVRDEVFVRDGARCTYKGPGGRRCGATQGLTLDHVTPFARGGGNTVNNLRLLCAQHNLMEAERVYGMDMMKQYRQRE